MQPNQKCAWVVENLTGSEDYKDLISEVQKSGRKCHIIDKNNRFQYSDFDIQESACLICVGSIQMVKYFQQNAPKGCFPVAFCSFESFLCSSYYPFVSPFLFNDKHAFTTLKNLKERKFEYYARFGKEALMFIRPDSGEKTFQAQLVDLQDFDRFWTNDLAGGQVKDDDLLIVSTPKKIIGEWRFVVDSEDIIAVSCYIFQDQKTFIPSAPTGATNLVNKILKELTTQNKTPDPVFCIDVCQGADEEFYLLELTSFSSAGMYSCNKKQIVDRVSKIAENFNNATNNT